jgi:hypothetical protein
VRDEGWPFGETYGNTNAYALRLKRGLQVLTISEAGEKYNLVARETTLASCMSTPFAHVRRAAAGIPFS